MSKASKGKTVYLVERAAYRAWIYSQLLYTRCESDQGESFTPVAAFESKEQAERRRNELEAEARLAFSPALFCESPLPSDLVATIKKLGLKPPKFGKAEDKHEDEFRSWWAKHAHEITPQMQAALWESFEGVSIYRVVEAKLKE